MTLKFNKPTFLAVISLFLFALGLRLWGVWHGLPYIYSVDEPALVHSVLGLRFDLNPHHFDWPHFHFYLSYLVFGIFYKARIAWQVWDWRPAMEAAVPILWNDGAIFYLLLRLLSVFMGALTVIPVYLASRELFDDKRKAFLAAFVLAIIPFHVENSKYALIDVPATFWAAWSFWLALRSFRIPAVKNYVLAGILAGLAASSKYNAVLVVLMLVLVHFVRVVSMRSDGIKYQVLSIRYIGRILKSKYVIPNTLYPILSDWHKLALAGGACVAAFFAGTPFAILDWKTFTNANSSTGALWQVARAGNRFELAAFSRLADSLVNKIGAGFGYCALAVALIGLVVALRSKNRLWQMVAIFSLIFYFYVGSSAFAPEQIFMPLYLALTPLFVVGAAYLVRLIRKEFFELPASWRLVFPLVLLALIFPTVLAALQVDYIYTQPDTRNLAKQFIDSAIPAGKVIGQEGEYQPYYEGTHPTVGVPAWRYEPLSQDKIEYVVVSGPSHVREIREDPKYGGILQNINPIYAILNGHDRLGPNIFIYKINYPLANQWWLNESKVPALSTASILSTNHAWRDAVLPASYTSVLAVTGNWDLSGGVAARMTVQKDFGYPTDKVDTYMRGFDLTLTSLSTPLKDGCASTAECVSDQAFKALINSGVDLVNIPSSPNFNETADILSKNKLGYSSPSHTAYQTANNVNFAFLNNDFSAKSISAARANKSRVVVVTLNWRDNVSFESESHAAIDNGADLVIGNSTQIGRIELYNSPRIGSEQGERSKNKLIIFGLGPFINSNFSPWTPLNIRTGGLIGKFYFFKERLVDVELVPVQPNSFDEFNRMTGQVSIINDLTFTTDLFKQIRDL